ncbi:nucleosome assembly protein 1-like 1 isoform X2 [Homarus americanus]|uniref:Nucleosome assembly protein 1-like 1-like n=1 Tax=Homarus americanus TaxID=6706 RepID=A0A8J5JWB4_HOMAM|nr:nucleosome assembly protein 1-like 1 isoform X2 [Homarus americanus]KAG7162464.1 Nucleosome assembly protein 1-like 1-like [Homarus americanus]
MADPEKGTEATPAPTQEEENMSEDEVEVDEDEEGGGERKELVDKLMKDPQVLAALQTKLRRFLGTPSGYISSLPTIVKRRIKALKKLQLQYTDLEAEFYQEVHALEVKYDKMHQSLYEKRRLVVNSEHEPNDEECDFPSDDEEEEDKGLSKDMEEKAKIDEKEESKVHDFDENTKGIPEFWLTIFKNVDLLAEMVQDYDEPILKHLTDIQLKFHDQPMGFTLEFHFKENDYFTNKVLTKYYEMKCVPDKEDPFGFEGPEIFKCKGCTIDWKKGKNVTVKTIKKKQKHKSRGAVRTITKTVQNDSFFNFFNPPPVPEDPDEEMDDDTQALLTADFEIGHYIRERIVPRAILFYTGEALDDEDFEEEEGEEGEEGDDEEEEDDPDYDPTKDKAAKGQPAECKQQ